MGRRRREVDVSEQVPLGQFREEITVESNAILTFESRTKAIIDPSDSKYNTLTTISKIIFNFDSKSGFQHLKLN